jgi:hypothetical protein
LRKYENRQRRAEIHGSREKSSDVNKSGGKIFQSASLEKSSAQTRGVNHGSSGPIRIGSRWRRSAEIAVTKMLARLVLARSTIDHKSRDIEVSPSIPTHDPEFPTEFLTFVVYLHHGGALTK